jgi:hypothetical protein
MYVISVHGLNSRALKEEGTEKISRTLPEISGFLSKNPIAATIVIRTNAKILI